MKARIWIILILTMMLAGLVLSEHFFVSDTINYLKEQSQSIQTQILENENINYDGLINQIDEFDKTWTKKENIMCLIINHKDMEKVGEQIKKLKVLSSQNKKQEAQYEAELLAYYIDGYEHFISVSFQNIF